MNDMSNNTSKEWDKENMRTVSCRLRKDEAEAFKRLCASKGTTVHAALARYIRLAIHDLPIHRPEEEGQKLVESLDGVEALWCTPDGDIISSSGWSDHEKK